MRLQTSLIAGVAIQLLIAAASQTGSCQTAAAVAAFNSYAASVEVRLARQHGSTTEFLPFPSSIPQPPIEDRLRRENSIVEQLTPPGGLDLPGALLHDWRGTAFVSGATAVDFERLLKDFARYPDTFSPQVLRAKILSGQPDHVVASMRVSQRHIITVVMDSTYDVTFTRLDAQHRSSCSRSTAISEIASPNTRSEHALSAADEHGFLWRQNSYWTWEERDGGLLIQIESLSLTRSIPAGLGWAVRPFIESVPRDSLEFTLRSARNALHR